MMSQPPPARTWPGVTDPLCIKDPTQEEHDRTKILLKFLRDSHLYKSEEESKKQNEALEDLKKILKDWVRKLATIHGRPVEEANAKLFTFGSYHLQTDMPGDDIDTLCVGPTEVNREHDFFMELRAKLEKTKQVTKMECLPDAHVPFMKFELNEVSIKLVYANISDSIIPEDLDVSGRSVLRGINDDVTLLSLNGHRVSAQILKLVPNIENFRTTLRCVMYWAKRRDICSNVTGFLRDCDWAILVARVCQLYPKAVPSTLICNFFQCFSQWYWPDPVLLCPIDPMDELGLPVWDSRPLINNEDRSHLMPIITPAYPCRNSRSDASESTRRFMKKHFGFGLTKCKNGVVDWAELFKPFNFFEAYVQYLHVDIMADNDEELRTLKKMVEPELRQLMLAIERDGELECYLCPIEYISEGSCAFFIGLSGKCEGIVNTVSDTILGNFNASMNLEMKLQCHRVYRDKIKSHKWGKQSLPVLQRLKR